MRVRNEAIGVDFIDTQIRSGQMPAALPTGLGFAAADAVLKSLGLQGLQAAAERAQLDGLLVLWHPAR